MISLKFDGIPRSIISFQLCIVSVRIVFLITIELFRRRRSADRLLHQHLRELFTDDVTFQFTTSAKNVNKNFNQ